MGLDEILEQVWRINPPYICITGGEPLMQAAELEPLLASLHKRGALIDIETNGTYPFTRLQSYASICMDVKCPSSGEQSDLSLLNAIRPQDSVKFVLKMKRTVGMRRRSWRRTGLPGKSSSPRLPAAIMPLLHNS
jgi:7-carboxy-7-deazaguanine synthase